MEKTTILVIDDEHQIRKLFKICFESENYKVILAENATEGLHLAASHRPSLIILDLNLPDKSGHEVLSELKEWYHNPVIVVSVASGENDIVIALDKGATDYMTKPFRTGELLARVRNALRRSNSDKNPGTLLKFGDIEVDLSAHSVRKNNQLLKLTSTEFQLLALFVNNEGRVLTHQYLLKEIWGISYLNETQYLRVFVASLRRKLEDDLSKPQHIITESGVGYRFQ